jgi:peptide/nickel transport system substrate-binding protein
MSRLWPAVLVAGLMLAAQAAAATLVVCDDDKDPLTLDPHRQFSEKNHTILQQVYEGLVRFTPDGRVESALALDWIRPKDDPFRMRFFLRKGVRFHNGEPFDARAVQYTIDRYLNPRTGFPALGFIDSIARVEVVDDHTLDIITRYPDGLLLNRLAGFVLIVPPGYFQQADEATLAQHPIGTGPFRFEKWERGQAIHLSANPDYWRPGQPRLEGLVFRFAPLDQQVDLLLNEKVDLVTELPGTMTGTVQSSGRTRVVKQQTFWTPAATMNIGSGPLSDVRVRRAMNLAIDRADIVRYNPDLKPYELDLVQAHRLLDEAGVKRPLILRTLVRTQTTRTASILKAQLARIGVELDIRAVVSDADVLQRLKSEPWDLAVAGVPDPMCHSFFIQSILLYSESPFSLMGGAASESVEVDRRLKAMAAALDPREQERLGWDLDRYVHEQALSLFTYQKIKTYGVRRGVAFTPYVSGMPYFFDTALEAKPGPSR